jgi:hypothetical protein
VDAAWFRLPSNEASARRTIFSTLCACARIRRTTIGAQIAMTAATTAMLPSVPANVNPRAVEAKAESEGMRDE